jgi:hypothetical protein
MKTRLILFLGFWTLALAGCSKPPASVAPVGQAAVESARTWLALVDGGNYAQSWEDAAAVAKAAVNKTAWETGIRAARTPLGKVVSRTLKSAQPTNSLPGAPDGSYVVIQFNTAFEHKASAVETVTPMLEKNGTWRVSGYYIR